MAGAQSESRAITDTRKETAKIISEQRVTFREAITIVFGQCSSVNHGVTTLFAGKWELNEIFSSFTPSRGQRPFIKMSHEDTRGAMMKELQAIAQDAIQNRLDNHEYKPERVDKWCSDIVSNILSSLKDTKTPQFKFVSSCMILSRRSQFVNETQIALWDTDRDIKITTKWANETMQCIVSVWAFRTRF